MGVISGVGMEGKGCWCSRCWRRAFPRRGNIVLGLVWLFVVGSASSRVSEVDWMLGVVWEEEIL